MSTLFQSLLFCIMAVTLATSLPAKILLYTFTAPGEFRHDSIPTAVQTLTANQSSINAIFDHTEDQTQFTDQRLANYDGIVFISTTGEILDDAEKAAFQKYLNLGGNFIGIHAASDCLRTTEFYGRELGAYFDYHPALQNATVDVVASHPSTSNLPAEWHVQDEMYNFKSDPRSLGAIVVLSANESSYTDEGTRKFQQGSPHPLAWYQEHGAGVQEGGTAGRSFYTALGHLNETWQDPVYLSHVLGGIQWTLQANTTRAFNSSAVVGNTDNATSGSSTSAGATSSTRTTQSRSEHSSSLGSLGSYLSILLALMCGLL